MPMTDEEFTDAYYRIQAAWRAAHNVEEGGTFYLLYDTAPEWPGDPVVDEPAFEAEFRTRMDGDQNPNATLVILPQ